MQAVITHPVGIAQGIESAQARGLIDVAASDVEQIVTRSSKQSAVERLGVYGSAYFARLLDCMQEDFPATRHAVGDDAFAGFVVRYLQKHPSTSYSLSDLHRQFPSFLADSRPAAQNGLSQPPAPDWIDFVIDLATLESTYCDVFDGPGEEQLPRLTPDSLARLTPDEWMRSRLQTSASLKLMEYRFPVHAYASAVRRGEPASIPAASPTRLAIHRRDYIVRRRPLTPLQFSLLGELQRGKTIGEAITESLWSTVNAADATESTMLETLKQQVRTNFREWAIEGYFRGIE
jgi:hypothetical protein